MITFEDVDITNLRRKNSKKKLRNPVNRNYKEALFLAIENKSTFSQLSIPAPILTAMTKSEPVRSTLEKTLFSISIQTKNSSLHELEIQLVTAVFSTANNLP